MNECDEIASIIRFLMNKDEEICGFILGSSQPRVVFPVKNISKNPRTEFFMDPHGILQAHKLAENMKLRIVALYHTHTKGSSKPSKKDIEGIKLWPIKWLIVSHKDHTILEPR